MKIQKDGATAIVSGQGISPEQLLEALITEYSELQGMHLIINLTSSENLSLEEVLRFEELSENHRAGNKSFVLISDKVVYDELPETLLVVPTLQEAKDLIQMEEIERDLDL